MSPQDLPSVVHRCHWYANDVGLPLQVQFVAVSVEPSRAVPLICGVAVFCGAAADRADATAPWRTAATTAVARIRGPRSPINLLIVCTPSSGSAVSRPRSRGSLGTIRADLTQC